MVVEDSQESLFSSSPSIHSFSSPVIAKDMPEREKDMVNRGSSFKEGKRATHLMPLMVDTPRWKTTPRRTRSHSRSRESSPNPKKVAKEEILVTTNPFSPLDTQQLVDAVDKVCK